MHSAHNPSPHKSLCAGVDLVLDTLITTWHHTPHSCARTVFLGLGSLALSLSFLRSRLSFGLWLFGLCVARLLYKSHVGSFLFLSRAGASGGAAGRLVGWGVGF